MINYIN